MATRRFIVSNLELDDYETASSSDYSDVLSAEGEEDPIDRVNITDADTRRKSSDLQIPDSEDPFAHTELVIKFKPDIKPEALLWFIDRVTAKKSRGGAELLLRREAYSGLSDEGLTVHVTAAGWRQLEVAEMLEIKKMDYTRDVPIPREFKIREIGRFLKPDMPVHELLTPAEKQIAVMHELTHVLCRPGERHVPGYPNYKLSTGQAAFHAFTSNNLITSYFPLHQEDELKKLEGKWWEEYKTRYEGVRSYFGDRVCVYFNFLAFYTWCLALPSAFGLLLFVLPEYLFNWLVIGFCIINMLYVTVVLILWQRRCAYLSFRWGTLKMHSWEEPRGNFQGRLGLDPVTGQFQRKYPHYLTSSKTVCSLLIVLICSVCAIAMSWLYLWLEAEAREYVKKEHKSQSHPTSTNSDSYMSHIWWNVIFPSLPGAGYAIAIFVLNKFYRTFSKWLTEWENHRTETQFERHLVVKLVIFEVINSFVILYYTAFILNDSDLLRRRLFVTLFMILLLGTLTAVAPAFLRTGEAKMKEFLDRHRITMFHRERIGRLIRGGSPVFTRRRRSIPYPDLENRDLEVMGDDDPRVQMSKVEENMDPYDYETDFDDYLQVFLEFGYIFAFSSAYPPAGILAIICNIVLLWASLFKLREVYQRPLAVRVSSIGAWQQAFEFMGIISVITNCAMLATNQELRTQFSTFSDTQWIVMCVCIEHIILLLQYFVRGLIPSLPYDIRVALAAFEYRSREALRREQAANSRRRVTQIFRPINEELSENPIYHRSNTNQRPNNPGPSNPQSRQQQNRQPTTNNERDVERRRENGPDRGTVRRSQ